MTNKTLSYDLLPTHIQGAAQRYVELGIPPGSFLTAVFQNQLVDAFARADLENRERMFDIASWVHNYAPLGCWGSKETMENWMKLGGLHGIRKGEQE